MSTYSFIDVTASINGPGGNFQLGYGSGASEEGLSLSMLSDKTTMSIGADGAVMQSLHAGNAGRCVVRLLKVSPTNGNLAAMYNTQRGTSSLWGTNTITVTNNVSGDTFTLNAVAFQRLPNFSYAQEGGSVEWEFLVGIVEPTIGTNLAGNLF